MDRASGPLAATIAGGFVRIEIRTLLHAWEKCRKRRGGAGDFRAWLAAHEMRARRGAKAEGGGRRAPSYGVAELARLGGVADRRVRDAARRLAADGLLTWAPDGSAVDFPAPPAGPGAGPPAAAVDTIAGPSGALSVPRRLLRFLARGARPALMATALGALLRCVSRRRSGFGDRGRLKASWVASAFGVDARRVKEARAELVALGWLRPVEGDAGQWAWNRWGRAYRVALDWAAPVADRHPPAPELGAGSPPPDLHPDPLPEPKSDPEPAPARPAGSDVDSFQVPENRPTTARPVPVAQAGAPAGATPKPDLADVRPEDLADAGRTLQLHEQAVRAGWASAAEADRLRFVAAAAHAQAVGRSNPMGLFRSIVRSRRWTLLTQADEDRARARLRDLDRPAPPPTRPARAADAAPGLPATLGALLDRFAPRRPGHSPAAGA